MRKLYFLFLPLVLLQLIACESNTDKNSDKFQITKYELVKADSIIVDYMENINILDFDRAREIILAYHSRSGDYIEFDLNGKILNRVNLIGEGPNDHGKNTYQVNYIGGGKVGVAAIGRYFIYDSDWELESKVDFDFVGSYRVTASGSYITSGFSQSQDASNPFITISSLGFDARKKEDLQNPHLFNVNVNTGEGKYFHHFPDSSFYLQSDQLFINMMDHISSYNIEKQVLDVIHRAEPILYRYDVSMAEPKLIDSYRFEYENPNSPRGIPFDSPAEVMMGGGGAIIYTNQLLTDIQSFGDLQLISYLERHPLSDMINPGAMDGKLLREIYDSPAKRWSFLIKDGKRISENIPNISPGIALQLGNGRFLSRNYVDPDIERDTQLFYIYELREVKD
jgi:hypothetical protein